MIIGTLAAVFALFVVVSAAIWLIMTSSVRKFPLLAELRSRLTQYLLVSGLVGLVLIFFRWEQISYLGSRIWLLIWLLIVTVWGAKVVYYLLKKFPEERRLFEMKRQYERYLPKSRKQMTS